MSDILTKRIITADEARAAASRLIAGSCRRDGERLDPTKRPTFSIPAKPDADDDLVLCAFIEQRRAASPADAGLLEDLKRLVQVLLDNDPNEDAADGVSVLDVWRKEVRDVLSSEGTRR